MLKKSLILLFIIFSFLCTYSICFATNTANNVKSTVNSGVNTVVDGAQNLVEDVRNGIGNAENGIEDALTMNTRANNLSATTGNYTAARTSDMATTTGTGTDTTTMWVWIILAIAAVVIVGLVWYYGSQNNID